MKKHDMLHCEILFLRMLLESHNTNNVKKIKSF